MNNQSKKVTGYKLAAVCAALSGVVLTGCSSSSSSDDGSLLDEVYEGLAYDGYLQNALVCVDENLNKACDSSEPQDITGAGGQFELTNLTDAQLALPLVMEATEDTIDEDNPDAPVDPNLKFLAPAGSTSISGLSTIVQVRVEQKIAAARAAGQEVPSLDDLKAETSEELAAELGIGNVDLTTYDPIAVKNDEEGDPALRLAAAKAHLINQVLSEQIITLRPQAEASANGDNRAAFGAAINKLDVTDIRNAVDNDTSGLALQDIVTATVDQVVNETPPVAPTPQEILDQADIDDEAEEGIEEQVPGEDEEPTGGTGSTGGTGGTGTS